MAASCWPPGEKSSAPPLRHRRSRRQPAFATIRQIEIARERNEHDGANDSDGKFNLSEKTTAKACGAPFVDMRQMSMTGG